MCVIIIQEGKMSVDFKVQNKYLKKELHSEQDKVKNLRYKLAELLKEHKRMLDKYFS